MKKLLKTTLLTAVLLFAATIVSAQTGKIVFDNSTHNFGSDVPEKGGDITHRFTFTNTGDAPVTIQQVTASCGCTTPAWTKEPVAPGQQGFVDATYHPNNRPGQFTKSLTVTNNGDQNVIILTISGTVVSAPPVAVEDTVPNK
ncbi:MAG: DUF1573 domain-containing protein [Prevotellaceae bacterium]|nr:DUF1573 domain-containing protein [Prevotellaceae bacterium]